MAESLKDIVRVVLLDQERVLDLEWRQLGGIGVGGMGGIASFVHELEGLRTVVLLAACFGRVIEVVHIFLVGLGLLVALSEQVRQ